MRVNKAPCGVTHAVSIAKGNITCNEAADSVKGGILKGTKYAWLCQGPFLKIIDISNGEKIAGWRFGAAASEFVTEVSCAVELPFNDEASNLKQIVLGLECEVIGGMICIFDVQGSRLLRAIRIPGKPLSLSIVDNGCSGCEGRYPLPGLLSSMSGIIAVGLKGGSVFLIDLCRVTCDELLNSWFNDDREEVRDEINPSQLLPINKDDDDSDKLEKKCATAAVSGDHLCLLLNESAFVQDNFLLLEAEGEVCAKFKSRNVGVTSLLYVPRIASLVVGYSFGCFQIWNLMQLTLDYTSHMMKDPLPIMHLGFLEPSDDPCNFCYLWAVHSTTDEFPSASPPVGIMYALSYDSKEWVDGYGYLYQDFQSCRFRFEYNLEVDASEDVDSICCISFSTFTNATAQKNMQEDGYDEATSENDFSLCIFTWEAYDSENKPVSTYLSLFDLNQWYKDQMPVQLSDAEDENLGYLVTFSLNCIRQKGEESSQIETPLLDVRVDPENLSQFKLFQPQEEHYHPSSLSFVSHCLLEDKVVSLSHPGLQRYLLLYMEKEGPICLLRPVNLFKHCVMVGLKPFWVDINGSNDLSAVAQREFLLSVALENQMLGFLHRCASDWANGSVSGVDCSLPMFLSWGFERAVVLKETADGLCVHLFDHTGIRLDKNECRLLDNCASQLRQLATLFEGILGDCRLLSLLNLEDFRQKTCELNLVALYFEVLLWFLNVGLLPEFPENDFDNEPSDFANTSVDKIPYPASVLTKFYADRRCEFKNLNLKNSTKASLYVDQLLQNESNGDQLANLWQSDGGSGLYPPPSIQSLLAMYLQDGIDIQTKNSIVIYVFLDLATLLDPERYSRTIEYFVKFPCAFCMTPSIIKVTQAFWLLDQKHFEDALDMVLDPLVSPKDLQPWQHRFIVHALLSQGQHNKALEYFTVRQLPIQGIEDIQLKITLLVMNKQVSQAYNFLQQYHNEENNRDLLYHFYQECGKAQQLGTVLKLMLSPAEEDLLMQYLQNCNISQSEDMQVVFYLMRSRVIEAVAVNEKINFSGTRKVGLRRTRNDPTVRDVLVGGYAKTLPSVTRQLANYCSQQKKLLSNWRQVQRPTPMSVDVHYGVKQPVSYKSSLIQATLEKARETWMMPVHSSFNSEIRNRERMDVSDMQNLPFLCTSHDTLRHDRETTPVVFPSVTSSVKRRLDDDGGPSTPLKRSRLENSPPLDNFLLLSNKKSSLDHSANNSSLLLKTPLVKRKTPLKQSNNQSLQEMNISKPFAESFTPQSILKVRNLVRSSDSPEKSRTAAENLLARDSNKGKHTDDRSCARQIRFSLPVPKDVDEQPLSSSTPAQTVKKDKTSNRIVDASARLPLRSSLTLLHKSVLSSKEGTSSGHITEKAPVITRNPVKQKISDSSSFVFCSATSSSTAFNFKSDTGINDIEDDVCKLNESLGEEPFYSASSSNDSGTSKENSTMDTDNENSSVPKNYSDSIKEIKPRRQLSRLKSGSPGLASDNYVFHEKEFTSEKMFTNIEQDENHENQRVTKSVIHKEITVTESIFKKNIVSCEAEENDSEDIDDTNIIFSKKSILGDSFMTESFSNKSKTRDIGQDEFVVSPNITTYVTHKEISGADKVIERNTVNSQENEDSDDSEYTVLSKRSILGDSAEYETKINKNRTIDAKQNEEAIEYNDNHRTEWDAILEERKSNLMESLKNKYFISYEDTGTDEVSEGESDAFYKSSILGDTTFSESKSSENEMMEVSRRDASENESNIPLSTQTDLECGLPQPGNVSSVVKIQQIKARRPLSRVRNSGNFDNSHNSIFETSSYVETSKYGKQSILLDDTNVPIIDVETEERKEVLDENGSEDTDDDCVEIVREQNVYVPVFGIVRKNDDQINTSFINEKGSTADISESVTERPKSETQRNVFQVNLNDNLAKEHLYQGASAVEQNVREDKFAEKDIVEVVSDFGKTFATLTSVTTEMSAYEPLLPETAGDVNREIVFMDNCNVPEDQRNILVLNPIEGELCTPVTFVDSVGNLEQSSGTFMKNDNTSNVCGSRVMYDISEQYSVEPNRDDNNKSVGEQDSCSTTGNTSGTIDLDSDESEEVTSRKTTQIQQISVVSTYNEKEDQNVPVLPAMGVQKEGNNEIIVIDSDTESKKGVPSEQQIHYEKSHKMGSYQEFFEEQAFIQDITHENSSQEPNESASVLKLPDSEVDSETNKSTEETSVQIMQNGDNTTSKSTESNLHLENNLGVASHVRVDSVIKECEVVVMRDDSKHFATNEKFEELTKSDTSFRDHSQNDSPQQSGQQVEGSSIIIKKTEEAVCVEKISEPSTSSHYEPPEVPTSALSENQQSCSGKLEYPEMSLKKNEHSEPSEFVASMTEVQARDPISDTTQEPSRSASMKSRRTSFQIESLQMNEVPASENEKVTGIEIQEVSTSKCRLRRRHSSVESERAEMSELKQQGNDQNVIMSREHPDRSDRPRRRSFLLMELQQLSDEPENKDGAVVREISTLRTRLRSRPSSVQSEPPQMTDFSEIEYQSKEQNVKTPKQHSGHGSRSRRRRSSLQTEPLLLDSECTSENKDGRMVMEKISTSKTRQKSQPSTVQNEPSHLAGELEKTLRGKYQNTESRLRNRPSSVQSEPPQMTDFSEIEYQTKEQNVETPKQHSAHGSWSRRRSSLQTEPLLLNSECTSENKDGPVAMEEISTPRSTQKNQPSTVQSEPSYLTGELEKTPRVEAQNIESSQKQSEENIRPRRRRSLQMELTQTSKDILTENKSERVEDQSLSIPRRRQRNRPSSVQSEPPQLSDIIVEENAADEDVHERSYVFNTHSRRHRRTKQLQLANTDATENKDSSTRRIRLRSQPSSVQGESSEMGISVETGNQAQEHKERKIDALISEGVHANVHKISKLPCAAEPQPSTSYVPVQEESRMNLRSRRAYSVDREHPNNKGKKESSDSQVVSDSDECSVQSEPPQLSDVSLVSKLRSRSRKGLVKKKKGTKSSYLLRIPPPKLPCVKEEPENEASIDEKEVTKQTAETAKSMRNFRSRKNSDSADDEGRMLRRSVESGDSLGSISSRTTIIIDHSGKRKRSSSVSSPDEPEVKKFQRSDAGNSGAKSAAHGEDEGKEGKESHTDEALEQYATARRLTRYQKTLMERSMDATKGIRHEYRRRLHQTDGSGDESDGESVASGYTSGSSQVRSSARLLQKRQTMMNRSPSQSSRASVTGDHTPEKETSRLQSPASSPEKYTETSPSSIVSGRSPSSVSSSQWPSPNSGNPHSPLRPRRKSFQNAQRALYSPSTKKHTLSKTSATTTDTSEAESVGESDVRISEIKHLKKDAETASESGRSQSSTLSSTVSRSTRSSSKPIETAMSPKSRKTQGGSTSRSDVHPLRELRARKETNTSVSSSSEDSPQKANKALRASATSESNEQRPAQKSEDLKKKMESRKSFSILKKRKFLKIQGKRKTMS